MMAEFVVDADIKQNYRIHKCSTSWCDRVFLTG